MILTLWLMIIMILDLILETINNKIAGISIKNLNKTKINLIKKNIFNNK